MGNIFFYLVLALGVFFALLFFIYAVTKVIVYAFYEAKRHSKIDKELDDDREA